VIAFLFEHVRRPETPLWFSVRSLCLCGECFSARFHHGDTENHRGGTEKSLTQLAPSTFSQPVRPQQPLKIERQGLGRNRLAIGISGLNNCSLP